MYITFAYDLVEGDAIIGPFVQEVNNMPKVHDRFTCWFPNAWLANKTMDCGLAVNQNSDSAVTVQRFYSKDEYDDFLKSESARTGRTDIRWMWSWIPMADVRDWIERQRNKNNNDTSDGCNLTAPADADGLMKRLDDAAMQTNGKREAK